jgi:hypothetical protein
MQEIGGIRCTQQYCVTESSKNGILEKLGEMLPILLNVIDYNVTDTLTIVRDEE